MQVNRKCVRRPKIPPGGFPGALPLPASLPPAGRLLCSPERGVAAVMRTALSAAAFPWEGKLSGWSDLTGSAGCSATAGKHVSQLGKQHAFLHSASCHCPALTTSAWGHRWLLRRIRTSGWAAFSPRYQASPAMFLHLLCTVVVWATPALAAAAQ